MSGRKQIFNNIFFIVVSFLLVILISWYSLAKLIKKNDRELALVTAAKIYDEAVGMQALPAASAETMSIDYGFHEIIKTHNGQKIQNYLAAIQKHFGWSTAFFADDYNHVYYTFNGKTDTVNAETEGSQWYWSLRNSDRNFMSVVAMNGQENDELTVYMDYKVFDSDGKFLGICGIGFEVKEVEKVFDQYDDIYGVKIYLLNEDGTIHLGTDSNDSDRNLKYALRYADQTDDYIYHTTLEHGYVISRYVKQWGRQFVIIRPKQTKSTSSILIVYQILVILAVMVVLSIVISIYMYHERKILSQQAKTDKMTGVLNKTGFYEDGRRLLEENNLHKVAFCFIDLDNFKSVNDQLGHETGDQAIKDAAEKIKSVFRWDDLIGRFGGDEFMVMVKNIDRSLLEEKLKTLVQKMENAYFADGKRVCVTASIGVVFEENCRNAKLEDIARRADEMLYKAKAAGKNRYCFEEDEKHD